MAQNREGYGGIWVNGEPFQLNAKCIVIGLMVTSVYILPKYAGEGNLWMMAFIFCMVYVGLSIYDVMYGCSARLTSGRFSITGPFKPQRRSDDVQPPPRPGVTWSSDQEESYLHSVHFAHVAVIGPLVMLTSYLAMHKRTSGVYALTLGLGALAILWHGMRLIWPRDTRP